MAIVTFQAPAGRHLARTSVPIWKKQRFKNVRFRGIPSRSALPFTR
jgi:hypothetical protein